MKHEQANNEKNVSTANGIGQKSEIGLHWYLIATTQFKINFSAAPEVQMDQQWGSANSSVVVKIDCNVHSNPPSQVKELRLIILKNFILIANTRWTK